VEDLGALVRVAGIIGELGLGREVIVAREVDHLDGKRFKLKLEAIIAAIGRASNAEGELITAVMEGVLIATVIPNLLHIEWVTEEAICAFTELTFDHLELDVRAVKVQGTTTIAKLPSKVAVTNLKAPFNVTACFFTESVTDFTASAAVIYTVAAANAFTKLVSEIITSFALLLPLNLYYKIIILELLI